MKKKVILGVLLTTATFMATGAVILSNSKESFSRILADPVPAEWNHYSRREATSSQLGIREYWVECGGTYQFTAPAEGNITDKGSAYDLSEFEEFDDRYFTYAMDEHYHDLTVSNFGASMYCVDLADYKNWRATYEANAAKFNLYSEGGKYLWRIDLPRIDYTKYPTVTMDVTAPNWYENNMMGPEADQLTYHTVYGGNKTEGKISLSLGPTGLHMEFNSLEYASTLAFEKTFIDSDIIHGLKSAYFYTEDLYDRYLNISNFVLSTASPKVAVMHFNGDTTKISTENAKQVKDGPSGDYNIHNHGYGTDENSLHITGNDSNTGPVTITMPAVNLNSYLSAGVITFTFGVRNNSEHMYWGSGDGKVDLGNNDSNSQLNDDNGYVNWQLQLTSSSARVYNVYQERYIDVTLSEAMLNGTAGIVISGGSDCRWRGYFVTDIYWSASLD